MDRHTLESMVRSARERFGSVDARTLRQQAIDGGLAAELLSEQATTLSRLGGALDAAVAALREIRGRAEGLGPDAPQLAALVESDRAVREELHRLRWEMQVVKEAMGLRGVRAEIDRFWPVPPRWAPR